MAVSEPDGLTWSIGGLADAAAVALMAFHAFDPHYREAWTEAQISGLLATAPAWLELAREDERLVGFALCRQAADEVELLLCATDPGSRRRGMGRRLVALVAEHAVSRSATRLFLEVRSSNAAALGLYRATGFTVVGRRPDYYRTVTGESIDAITLAQAL